MRAGRLLETRGDKDGAIERYKMALDANPKDTSASAALRKAYAHRGDWLSAIGLVERELTHAEGDLAKARLHAELAKIYHSQLVDPDKAEAAAKKAIALDSSSADALMVLGDLAFEAQPPHRGDEVLREPRRSHRRAPEGRRRPRARSLHRGVRQDAAEAVARPRAGPSATVRRRAG